MKKIERTMKLMLQTLLLILIIQVQGQGNERSYPLPGQATRDAADPITISGIVTGQEGETLIGVNVQVKGTNKGTSTDFEGHFQLNEVDVNDVLVFSYIGYQTMEVPVEGRSKINVTMATNAELLDEVVVVGYGVQKKVNLTGAVDVVTQEDIQNRSVTNVTEALQGVSPNLNISPSEFSNEPGGAMSINIRGVGSLTGDYSPYVLVDGMPMNINLVNPSDIESISVLKDAAASAIYGARAPYGVILITTKKGSQDGKIRIDYNNNISFASPIGMPHMANTLDYMAAHDQASVNAGLAPNFTEFNYQRVRDYMDGKIKEETWLLDDGSDWAGNDIWNIAGNGNNDWMYIYYKDNVMRQKHDVSISGGGRTNSFYISAGLLDQPGELRFGDEKYKRYNVNANLVSDVTDWLSINLNTKYIRDFKQYFNAGGFDRRTQYHNFFRTNPFRPLYLPNGEFSYISYIPPMVDPEGKERQYFSQASISLGATLEPIPNWVTRITYNYRDNNSRFTNYHPTIYGTAPDGEKRIYESAISNYQTTFNNEGYTLYNISTSYHLNPGEHYFYLLGGFEFEETQFNNLWGSKNELLVYNVPAINTAVGEHYTSENKTHWATAGLFTRFQYNYKEKYLFEANLRYDGSSKFENETRWGLFPSVSVGYNIYKENFWQPLESIVNTLRIKASWGALGNQNVPNYLYLPSLGIGTDLSWIMGNDGRPSYTTAPGLISANLTWETATTTNLGIEASFLDGRLTTSFDLYQRITTDMFGPAEALPILLGTSPPRANNATLQTNGIEIALGWQSTIGSELSYSIRATLADNVSKVTKYNNPTKSLNTWYEGQILGEIWGLQSVGIYQTDAEAENGPDQSLFYPRWGAGDIHYRDLDGDNIITRGTWTADNSGDYSVIGNQSPRFLTGLMAGVQWKGFDVSMFWQGILKRDYAFNGDVDMTFFGFLGQQWWGMNMWEKGNHTTLDYWRPSNETNALGPNTDAYYPRPYLSEEDYKNKKIQTRYTQNASYLRLKNLSIGYQLPANIMHRTPLSNVKIYLSGENLLTITKLTKLIDPEALSTGYGGGTGKIHFPRKVYSVGLNVSF